LDNWFTTSGDLKCHVPKMVECSYFWTSNGRPHNENILFFMDLAIVKAFYDLLLRMKVVG
jgi:hypothetical protein